MRFTNAAGETRYGRYRIAYLRALAVLAHWRSEDNLAIAHLQEALLLSEALGLPGERWQLLACVRIPWWAEEGAQSWKPRHYSTLRRERQEIGSWH